jgi:hypothetical protein
VARLAKELAVLLLRHALATLLDDGTHETSFFGLDDYGLLATALNFPTRETAP